MQIDRIGVSLKSTILIFVLGFSGIGITAGKAQDSTTTKLRSINVYLDCRDDCDESYIRNEITFVHFVRNKETADIHILITTQGTGSGGEEYSLRFIGSNEFAKIHRTLTYYTTESDTEDKIREGLNNYLKMGLFSFVATRPIAKDFKISYEPEDSPQEPATQSANWDHWIFEISADTELEGEESEKEFSLQGEANIERVTPEWKLEFGLSQDYERQTFEDDDTTQVYTTISREADAMIVKSLGKHWSIGITSRIRSSTNDNIVLLAEGSPALEYSVFPYEEFSEREFTFQYRITGGYYNYDERTIYDQTSEYLLQQQLNSNIQLTQPWGEFEAEINGSAYLHDLNKNRLDTELQLNFRIYRGFSVFVSGEYAWINNQLSIPAGDITDAELLLDLRERSTSYSYATSFGLEFSFGSIYNNVVNPRL